MPIFRYKKTSTSGPNGSTIYFNQRPDDPELEIATFDGFDYIFSQSGELQEQDERISIEEVFLDNQTKDLIKKNSHLCKSIEAEMQNRIREQYSLEDEQYFARIGVGAALGAYEFEPGEQDELLAFGAHVESVRAWGRAKRAEIGL